MAAFSLEVQQAATFHGAPYELVYGMFTIYNQTRRCQACSLAGQGDRGMQLQMNECLCPMTRNRFDEIDLDFFLMRAALAHTTMFTPTQVMQRYYEMISPDWFPITPDGPFKAPLELCNLLRKAIHESCGSYENFLPVQESQELEWVGLGVGYIVPGGGYQELNMAAIYGQVLEDYYISIRNNCHAAFRDGFQWVNDVERPFIDCRCRNCWTVWAIRDMEENPNEMSRRIMYPPYHI